MSRMKKFFEEPSIECVKLYSESIADGAADGQIGTGTVSGDVNPED